jgi:hypothetical protein
MILLIVYLTVFIVVASIACVFHTIFMQILTHFYGKDADLIAKTISSVLKWTFGICAVALTFWLLLSAFGLITTIVLTFIVICVTLFIGSF